MVFQRPAFYITYSTVTLRSGERWLWLGDWEGNRRAIWMASNAWPVHRLGVTTRRVWYTMFIILVAVFAFLGYLLYLRPPLEGTGSEAGCTLENSSPWRRTRL